MRSTLASLLVLTLVAEPVSRVAAACVAECEPATESDGCCCDPDEPPTEATWVDPCCCPDGVAPQPVHTPSAAVMTTPEPGPQSQPLAFAVPVALSLDRRAPTNAPLAVAASPPSRASAPLHTRSIRC